MKDWRIKWKKFDSKENSIVKSQSSLSNKSVQNSESDASIITEDAMITMKQRQVMSIATSPGKSLFTTAFMLWMSGSSIQIFSIMTTGMALVNPIKALFSIKSVFVTFEKEEKIDLLLPKLIFIALQILSIAVALYKCSTMGLLPLTSADWTSLIPDKTYLEVAAIPSR
eukprot:gene19528-25425_t